MVALFTLCQDGMQDMKIVNEPQAGSGKLLCTVWELERLVIRNSIL